MATTTINPVTGRPVSEDWFWPESRQASQPLFLPGGAFNATWREPYVGTPQVQQAPVQQQPPASSVLADLIRQPQPSAPAYTPAPAPAPNPFADVLANSYKAPPPVAPQASQFVPQAIPAAPKLQTATTLRTTPQLTQAEQRLQDLINNPSSLQDSASYKFRFDQGQEALQRSLGARGLLNSGNRLLELTKYGQDMGSQEYEAENARRMALLNSYAGNYNTDQSNNINLYGIQQGSMDKNYGTAADLFKARGATLANLYGGADTTGTQRYGIDTTAGTARMGTLADLYRTDVQARAAQEAEQTKRMDWAYKSQIDEANAMAKAQQALGRMAPKYGPTTENWWS